MSWKELTEREIEVFLYGIRIQKALDSLNPGKNVPYYTSTYLEEIHILPRSSEFKYDPKTHDPIPIRVFSGCEFLKDAWEWLKRGVDKEGNWKEPDEILYRKFSLKEEFDDRDNNIAQTSDSGSEGTHKTS